jgi:hypothetical protein
VKLEPAQLAVLEAVSAGAKTTSNVTRGDVVSGTCAVGLEKKGLVSRETKIPKGSKVAVLFVKITPEGRKVLKAAQKAAA